MPKFAKATKGFICVLLALMLCFSFVGCNSSKVTEQDVTKTVDKAVIALRNFDKKKMNKYIDSQTLSYIITLSKGHDQFVELGKAIFQNLEIEVEEVDLENQTVTLSIRNKSLFRIASSFTRDLLKNYSTLQIVNLLKNEDFLDRSLKLLVDEINEQTTYSSAKSVTLNYEKKNGHIVLSLDEDAEKAFSGGALTAVKQIIKK